MKIADFFLDRGYAIVVYIDIGLNMQGRWVRVVSGKVGFVDSVKKMEMVPVEDEQTIEYVSPEVVTYCGDTLLEEMGPARACGASVPACPISD